MEFRGWGIARWLMGAQLVASIGWFAFAGTEHEAVRRWVVWTAWESAILFLIAFTARPIRQFLRTDFTKAVLKNRRYVGASAAFAHFLHLIAVVWFVNGFPEEASEPIALVTLIGGGLGFALYLTMGITSNDVSVKTLGLANWKRLHTFAGYYVWFIFMQTFLGGAVVGGSLVSAAFSALFVLGLAVRIAARLRQRAAGAA